MGAAVNNVRAGIAGMPFLGSFTLSELTTNHAAANYPGLLARVTDYGKPYLWVISDGTRWVPAWPQMLASSSEPASVPADTNENILATIAIPPPLLGISGSLQIETLWTVTSSVNDKTSRTRLGGIGGTSFSNTILTTTASNQITTIISNRAAANSQVGSARGSRGTDNIIVVGGTVIGAINMAAAQDLVITGQKEIAGETMTLERRIVHILP
jgi:hypothetical protein